MRKLIITSAGVLAALAVTAPASAEGETTSVTAESPDCGIATITYTNPTQWTFWGDYRVGQEPGEPDEVTGQPIAEGPLGGEDFGEVYHPVELAPGAEETVTVEPEEDQGGGTVSVKAWVNRGPEQRAFAGYVTVEVPTDCETEPTTPSEPAPSEPAPSEPAPSDPPAEPTTPSEPTEPTTPDGGDGLPGDEPTEDGKAPKPTPMPGHLDVTG